MLTAYAKRNVYIKNTKHFCVAASSCK